MEQIREGVFETNSSSSHSITIKGCNKDLYLTIVPDDDGTITLVEGEYGWGYNELHSPYEKACYAATDRRGYGPDIELLKETIKQHTGAKDVIITGDGYVDHQSQGTSAEVFNSKKTLKDYLFSPHSYVIIDNDNH